MVRKFLDVRAVVGFLIMKFYLNEEMLEILKDSKKLLQVEVK
jgi:hypothetical protein